MLNLLRADCKTNAGAGTIDARVSYGSHDADPAALCGARRCERMLGS